MIYFGPARLVPAPLVDLDHFPGVAGYPAIGQEVGRIGEYHVETPRRMRLGDFVHEIQAVGVVEFDAGLSVCEYALAGARRQDIDTRGDWPGFGPIFARERSMDHRIGSVARGKGDM